MPVTCPKCHKKVPEGNCCSQCGARLKRMAAASGMSGFVDAPKAVGGAPAAAKDDIQQSYQNCGIRSQEIILRDYFDPVIPCCKNPSQPCLHVEDKLFSLALKNDWCNEEGGTEPLHRGKVLDFFGIPVTRYENANIFNVHAELARGHRIIASVHAQDVWKHNPGKPHYTDPVKYLLRQAGQRMPNHALVLSGMNTDDPNNPMIVITDSGAGQVAQTISFRDFTEAWKDSNHVMVATNIAPNEMMFVKCAACGMNISSLAAQCPYCSRAKCPACSKDIPSLAVQCPHCSQTMVPDQDGSKLNPQCRDCWRLAETIAPTSPSADRSPSRAAPIPHPGERGEMMQGAAGIRAGSALSRIGSMPFADFAERYGGVMGLDGTDSRFIDALDDFFKRNKWAREDKAMQNDPNGDSGAVQNATREVECPKCKQLVNEEKFCSKCGHPLKAPLKPVFEDNTWRARPGEFCARIRMPDPEGFFKRIFESFKGKKLIVEDGTKAVIFEDGKNVGVIEPGEYTLDSFWSRFNRFFSGKNISIILYNDGDLELSFNIKGCSTKEGLAIEVKTSLDVRIDNAALFVSRQMGHDDVLNVIQLRNLLYRPIEITLKGSIRQCGIDELRNDMNLQKTFDQALETALSEFLSPQGIAFGRIRTFDFTHPVYDDLQELKGMLHLQIDAKKAGFEHKEKDDALNHEVDKQSYRRAAMAQEIEKMKAGLKQTGEEQDLAFAIDRFEKIEKAELALRNAKSLSTADADLELEVHADRIRQERLLRDSDRKALELALSEKNISAQMKAEKALKILKDACDKEFQIAQAASQHQLDMARFDHEEELLKRTDERLARELSVQIQRDRVVAQNGHRAAMEQLLHDVDIRKITREEEAKDGDARRSQAHLDAQADAAITDIGRAGRAKDWDAELGKLQGLMSLDADKARQEAELREKEEAAKHARTLDVLDRDAKREMERAQRGRDRGERA